MSLIPLAEETPRRLAETGEPEFDPDIIVYPPAVDLFKQGSAAMLCKCIRSIRTRSRSLSNLKMIPALRLVAVPLRLKRTFTVLGTT